MLVHVLGALLAASVGTGPHKLQPDEVCLLGRLCAREPVFCLVDDPRCAKPGGPEICFVTDCDPPRDFEPPTAPGS